MTMIEINVCNTIFDDEECLEDAKEKKKKDTYVLHIS